MNITFLIILMTWTFVIVFVKNTLKIDIRGLRLYVWIIISSLLFATIEMAIVFFSGISSLPHFLFLSLPIQLTIGPCLYLLVRDKAWKSRKSRVEDYSHFLTAILGFILMWTFYSLDGTPKLEMIKAPSTVVMLVNWLLVIQLVVYAVRGLLRLHLTKPGKRDLTDSRWLLMVGFACYLAMQLMLVFGEEAFLLSVFTHILLIGMVWKYKLVNTIKSKPSESNTDMEVIRLVEKAMQDDQLYLRPDLTLSVLAATVNLNTNKISGALNNALSIHYNDYLNRYRVNEVIRLLENKTDSKFTLEAISKMSGFKSLTTFNTAFKKETGKTPKQYKV